ncbi:MAG: UDP-2,4-diacetamido-2,4,6-trideoxy-beta-L-altropyranose hydrolase, partial [Candidatus Margulisiibacteriota bacterium]
MKMVIITEGCGKAGFGHITRCLAIGQAFEERGVFPKYIVNGDRTILGLLKGKDSKIINWLKNRDRLIDLIDGADIALVDSYLATTGIYKMISQHSHLLVSYDDNNRLPYPAGVVVNGAL